MKTTLHPMGKHVIVRQPPKEEKRTASGIVIPQTSSESVVRGVVVGDPQVAGLGEGDAVLFWPFQAQALEMDGEELAIVSADAIIAKYEETSVQ